MDPDFVAGLEVTGLGMGLVFLTLILIMLLIRLLGRVFPAQVAADQEESPAARVAEVAAAVAPVSVDADEIAAIALAIAVAGTARRAPAPAAPASGPEFDYGNITGEIISVIRVDPGPSNWSRQGRLSATL